MLTYLIEPSGALNGPVELPEVPGLGAQLPRTTTLSNERFTELLAHIQTLRDWPASEAFPSIDKRPVAPPWVAEYIQ